jgi:hypothetical protein
MLVIVHIMQHGPIFTFSLLQFEIFRIFIISITNFYIVHQNSHEISKKILSPNFMINSNKFDKKVG